MKFLFDILGDACCHFKPLGKKEFSQCLFSISQTPKPFVMRIEQNQALVCHGWWWGKRGLLLTHSGPISEAAKTKDRSTAKHTNFFNTNFPWLECPSKDPKTLCNG